MVPLGLPDLAQRDVAASPAPSPDETNVLFVGRLEPRKGIDVLLEAVPSVLAACPGVTFTIAGQDAPVPGGRRTQVEQFTATADPAVAQRVRFAGRVDDDELARLYQACDIFVCPSRFESFGLILLEAMMFRKPTVAVRVGGMQYIVEDGETGLLLDAADATALSDAIIALARDPELRQRLGNQGRLRYEERFSQEAMVEGVVQYYRQLIATAPEPVA
jgi:glycosyltransferase involved in cell wall biosynthesis